MNKDNKVKALPFQKPSKTSTQFILAVFASICSFLVDLGVLAFLTEVVKLYYLYSAIIGFLTGTAILYLLSIFLVFNQRRFASIKIEFLVFLSLSFMGLCLNIGLLHVFTEIGHIHYFISRIVVGAIVFFLNFTLKKILLFTKKGTLNSRENVM